MPQNVTEITKLAKQIASQELSNSESSAELLKALGSVAKLLEERAGIDTQVKELAVQVQELVKAKDL